MSVRGRVPGKASDVGVDLLVALHHCARNLEPRSEQCFVPPNAELALDGIVISIDAAIAVEVIATLAEEHLQATGILGAELQSRRLEVDDEVEGISDGQRDEYGVPFRERCPVWPTLERGIVEAELQELRGVPAAQLRVVPQVDA